MSCEDIRPLLAGMSSCADTEAGTRLATHCLYPSFEPVHVYINKVGDGYRVHDGAGAFSAAWLHGRDKGLIHRALKIECDRFHLRQVEDSIVGEVGSAAWLPNLVIGVANASALGAYRAVEKIVAAAEEALVARIDRSLSKTFGEGQFSRNVERTGRK